MLTVADVAAGYGSVTVTPSVTLAGIVPATTGRIAFDGHDYAALDARS